MRAPPLSAGVIVAAVLDTQQLENELVRLGKARQRRRCGVENRPAAQFAFYPAVKHGLAGRTSFEDAATQPPAILDLVEQSHAKISAAPSRTITS